MFAQSLLSSVRSVVMVVIFLSSEAFAANLVPAEAISQSTTLAGTQEECMVACSDEHGRCIRWGNASSACGDQTIRCVRQCRAG